MLRNKAVIYLYAKADQAAYHCGHLLFEEPSL